MRRRRHSVSGRRSRVVTHIDLAGEALVREFTRVQPAPFVPEFRLHLAAELVPLWQATEWRAAAPQPPPFWAFAWPGSQALARYLLGEPALIQGRRVLDFGSGGGLAAIAAASLGAARVRACDLDPLASVAQRLNAQLNDVTFERTFENLLERDPVDLAVDVDVVLAGDVCYDRASSECIIGWLRRLAACGPLVLLADPGRSYAPTESLELLASYDVPTLHELESVQHKLTQLWRLQP
jgi:predicted nicotinamide N-methyase